jgi:hypothetical protein
MLIALFKNIFISQNQADMSGTTIKQIATVSPIDPEALKPIQKPQRALSIIKEFSLNTSAHGLPGIARSQSIHNRIFWSVVVIGFTGIMLFFVTQAIRAYFDYPSQTSISVIFEWPQAFPAVTICNYSPLRYDRFIGPFLNYTNTFNITNTTDTTNFTMAQTSSIFQFLSYKLNRSESLNDLFYPLDGMMISCNYNGISCSAGNFTSFITPTYGLCYTFNAKLKDAVNDGLRYNSDNGQNGVFQVRLYTHEHQYVPYISQGNDTIRISLF